MKKELSLVVITNFLCIFIQVDRSWLSVLFEIHSSRYRWKSSFALAWWATITQIEPSTVEYGRLICVSDGGTSQSLCYWSRMALLQVYNNTTAQYTLNVTLHCTTGIKSITIWRYCLNKSNIISVQRDYNTLLPDYEEAIAQSMKDQPPPYYKVTMTANLIVSQNQPSGVVDGVPPDYETPSNEVPLQITREQ